MTAKHRHSPKTALVTGASSGIGLEFAKILASQKYNLVIVSNQEQIHAVANDIATKYKVKVAPVFLDLATNQAAHKLYRYCQERNLEIDILINNAGKLVFGEIDQLSNKTVSGIIKLHVQTPTTLCKLFGTDMKRRQRGYILLMSSISTWMPYPILTLYAVTKRYLTSFGKALHYEMKVYNVGVTTICPGAVNTNFFSLSTKKRRLALKLRIMLDPKAVAKKSLQKMFKKRVRYIPGGFNKLILLPICRLTPMCLIHYLKCKLSSKIKTTGNE